VINEWNALSSSGIFNFQINSTVYSRAEALANGDGLVGFSYDALKDAFMGRTQTSSQSSSTRPW
jgi:hypothetical protein